MCAISKVHFKWSPFLTKYSLLCIHLVCSVLLDFKMLLTTKSLQKELLSEKVCFDQFVTLYDVVVLTYSLP